MTALGVVVALIVGQWAAPAAASPTFDVSVTEDEPGRVFTFTASGISNGNYTDVHVWLRDVPAGAKLLGEYTHITDCNAPAGCLDDFAYYWMRLGDLSTGEPYSASITIAADEDAPAQEEYHEIYPSVHDAPGPQWAEDAVIPITVVPPPPSEADLAVGLDATSSVLSPSRVSYDLEVTNEGPADATTATVDVTYGTPVQTATGTGCLKVGPNTVRCQTGPIPAGGTVQHAFDVRYGLLTIGVPLSATATLVASDPADPNPDNDVDTAHCTVVTSLLVLC